MKGFVRGYYSVADTTYKSGDRTGLRIMQHFTGRLLEYTKPQGTCPEKEYLSVKCFVLLVLAGQMLSHDATTSLNVERVEREQLRWWRRLRRLLIRGILIKKGPPEPVTTGTTSQLAKIPASCTYV